MCRIKSHPNYNKTVFSSCQWECMTFAKFAKQFLLFFQAEKGGRDGSELDVCQTVEPTRDKQLLCLQNSVVINRLYLIFSTSLVFRYEFFCNGCFPFHFGNHHLQNSHLHFSFLFYCDFSMQIFYFYYEYLQIKDFDRFREKSFWKQNKNGWYSNERNNESWIY